MNPMELSGITIGEIEYRMEELQIEIADTETALFILEEDDDDYDEQAGRLQMYLEELEAAHADLVLIWDLKCGIEDES